MMTAAVIFPKSGFAKFPFAICSSPDYIMAGESHKVSCLSHSVSCVFVIRASTSSSCITLATVWDQQASRKALSSCIDFIFALIIVGFSDSIMETRMDVPRFSLPIRCGI